MSRTKTCDEILFELAHEVSNAKPTEETREELMDVIRVNMLKELDENTERESKLRLRAGREAVKDAQPELDTLLERARNNDCLPEQTPGDPRQSIEKKVKDSIRNDVMATKEVDNRSDAIMDILEDYLD